MADAGANIHALARKDQHTLDHVVLTPQNGLILNTASGSKLRAYGYGRIPSLQHLPTRTQTAYLFEDEDLSSGSLLAVGELAQQGHVVTYRKGGVEVTSESTGDIVMQGTYDPARRLYFMDLDNMRLTTSRAASVTGDYYPAIHQPIPQPRKTTHLPPQDTAFAIYDATDSPIAAASANLAISHNNIADKVAYYHKAFGSPPKDTLLKALDAGYLSGMPGGLTPAEVRKYLPQITVETALGHMARTKAGLHSTTTIRPREEDEDNSDDPQSVAHPKGTHRTHRVQFKVIERQQTDRNHMDATGPFPVTSAQGTKHLMVFVCEDTDYAHLENMTDLSAAATTAAFRRGYKFYEAYGFAPKFERLDNAISQLLLDEMQQICGVVIELVPPGNHRALYAERLIRIVKDHLISTYATADPAFPIKYWDEHEQPEATLNLLRSSRMNPHRSAYEQLRGPFPWNSKIIAPWGMRICAYESPATRPAFGQRCTKGFLLGYSPRHHRCWKIVTDDGGIRVTDTLAWLPRNCVMPGVSAQDRLEAALRDVATCATDLQAEVARGRSGDERGVPHPQSLLQSIATLANLGAPPEIPEIQSRPPIELIELIHPIPLPAERLRVPDAHAQSQQQQPPTPDRLRVPTAPDTAAARTPTAGSALPRVSFSAPLVVATPPAVSALPTALTAPTTPAAAATQPPQTFSDLLSSKKATRRPKKPAPPTNAQQPVPAQPPPSHKDPPTQLQLLRQQEAQYKPPRMPTQLWRQGQGLAPLPPAQRSTRRAPLQDKPTPRPDYVPATATELQSYTVRQLRDLMSRYEISTATCITRDDLVAAIVAANVDVRHKLTARETLAHVRASTAGTRANRAQRRLLKRAERVHVATANAVFASIQEAECALEDSISDGPPPHAFAYATTDETTGETLVWRRLVRPDNPTQVRWILATDQEWDRLIEETKTLEFINPDQKEAGRTASYMSMAASLKPDTDGNLTVPRVRGAYGGNVTDYDGPRSANTASQAAVKTLLNAIVSDPTARCMTADAKDFYLMTDLDKFEYMWIERAQIPDRTFHKYGLENLQTSAKGMYMVRVKKGMYGLPHAGRIAAIKVTELLAQAGYRECRQNKMVFRHETRDVTFTLVVDDFLVKYSNRADAEHLIKTLEAVYVMKTDWDAKKYLGISLEWDYASTPRSVALSMPNYVEKGVQRFAQWLGPLRKTAHGPGLPAPRIYGVQPAKTPDSSPELPADEKKELQRLVGYFRYYAESIDCTQLVKLGQLASQQNKPTEATKREAAAFLDYVATWPNATLTYRASDMVLRTISDGSHRGEPFGGCRIGGIHFLGAADCSDINGALLVVCRLLDVQSSSACETELGALYENARAIAGLRTLLDELGYTQTRPTEVECDNKCAVGIACETEKQKRAAAMDMRFLWVADRVRQGQIHVRWSAGQGNLADYVTKIHPHKHHRDMRKFFVSDPIPATR